MAKVNEEEARLYRTLKRLIERGQIEGLENKIDRLWAAGKLSNEHYNELITMLHPEEENKVEEVEEPVEEEKTEEQPIEEEKAEEPEHTEQGEQEEKPEQTDEGADKEEENKE